ncbi:HAMP domain-containing sensor histidine kinase [uncultured Pseudoteredinibacter sp.]|uniref:sensor histidine kinase n=1 Tax=uncultured Pseudoteredinibacter sp. TaxID=1641701 RepID=UPI00261921C5|nr:HAMP domain-containing sensor histidine kinase [uncultured Pseudoteredinibacter sp.]
MTNLHGGVSLKSKVYALVSLLILIMVTTVSLIYFKVMSSSGQLDNLLVSNSEIRKISELRFQVEELKYWLSNYSRTYLSESKHKSESRRQAIEESLIGLQDRYPEFARETKANIDDYYGHMVEATDFYIQDLLLLGNSRIRQAFEVSEQLNLQIDNMYFSVVDRVDSSTAAAKSDNVFIMSFIPIALILSTVIASLIAYLFASHLTNPIDYLCRRIEEIRENFDLSHRIDKDCQHQELNKMAMAFNDLFEELRSIQGELVESAKMAALGQLVAGVAHELNTPIGVCITANSTLKENTDKVNKKLEQESLSLEDLQKYIARSDNLSSLLKRNLERSANLVASFKEVAVEQNRNEVREFDLHAALWDIITSFDHQLNEHHVDITLNCPEDITLKSDLGGLYSIITNLLLNTINHAFKDKEAGCIVLDVESADRDKVKFTFSDDGRGMGEDELSQIFTPFYTTTQNSGGTGLGLSIVYNTVSKMKGDISCESTVGVGTSFHFEVENQELAEAS